MTPRDVDGDRFAWRETGPEHPGPDAPVLLLHGLGGSRTAWEPQLAALGTRRRVVAWDMPGYGAAPPLAGPMTFPALADAVAALLDAAGADTAHLVGLSMGGMVAQHAALRHPDRVRSLVLVDSSPRFGLDGTTTAAAWQAARLAPLDRGGTPATMAPAVIAAITAPGADPTAVAAAVAAMARVPAAALRAAVACLVTHDLLDDLARIAAPTLVLVGEHDHETPLPYAEALARGIPDARLAVVPGAGHLANLERPVEVNATVDAFLQEVDAATVPRTHEETVP
jgi:3-oxoadipate enol-lactonase